MSNNYTYCIERISYSKNKKKIINNVSMDIKKNKVTAIIGQNGSGKSTLLKILSGIIKPQHGSISLDGKDLNSFSNTERSKKISFMPQSSTVPSNMKALDLIACGRYPHLGLFGKLSANDFKIMNNCLAIVDMKRRSQCDVSTLSGGEMQRIWLAMILAQDTDIILLDEPTSWMDIKHQLSLTQLVYRLSKELDKTIVWVLHDINQAIQFSDEVVMMKDGGILKRNGSTEKANKSSIENTFGVNIENISSHNLDKPFYLPISHKV